jgi:hypothetical protein
MRMMFGHNLAKVEDPAFFSGVSNLRKVWGLAQLNSP